MSLSLSLLEPFTATLDGREITSLVPEKGWALLTYLAMEPGRPHRREALAELLWPERPMTVALGNLRPVLSRLRRAIGDDHADRPLLLIERDTIQLNPAASYHIDLAELAAALRDAPPNTLRLREAVATCRGRAPRGPLVPDSPAFEDWWLLRQGEAERHILAALSLLAAHHQARGEYDLAAEYARANWSESPGARRRMPTDARLGAEGGAR